MSLAHVSSAELITLQTKYPLVKWLSKINNWLDKFAEKTKVWKFMIGVSCCLWLLIEHHEKNLKQVDLRQRIWQQERFLQVVLWIFDTNFMQNDCRTLSLEIRDEFVWADRCLAFWIRSLVFRMSSEKERATRWWSAVVKLLLNRPNLLNELNWSKM